MCCVVALALFISMPLAQTQTTKGLQVYVVDVEGGNATLFAALYGKAKHTIAHPGDRIAVSGLDWRIVAAAGNVIKTPLPGGGRPNPSCARFAPQEPDTTENAQSVASVIAFGSFRMTHLGDL